MPLRLFPYGSTTTALTSLGTVEGERAFIIPSLLLLLARIQFIETNFLILLYKKVGSFDFLTLCVIQ